MTTTEAKADAAVAKSGKAVKSKDAGQAGLDLIGQLVAQARAEGLDLVGEGGLLQQLTKRLDLLPVPGPRQTADDVARLL